MTIDILMPALSPTMEEGTLAKWLVKEGDAVHSGDVIAEIETDKATMEFEAVDEGVIGAILLPAGRSGVKVNTPIAVLLEEGEDASALKPAAAAGRAGGAAAQSAPNAEAKPSPLAPPAHPAHPAHPAAHGDPAEARPPRRFASPLARRIAADKGIDLATLTGSGPYGRIVKADVLRAASAPAPVPAPAPEQAAKTPPAPTATTPTATRPAGPDTAAVKKLYQDRAYTEIELDGMRKTIAARLSEAKQTIPHFYLRREVRLDALLALRSQVNAQLEARGVKLSVNDFIIKACALALQAVPAANAVWAGDRILQMKASDVAVAVAIKGGLFTPVLRDAEAKSLSALSAEMKDLAARARVRKLAPHEYQGGSFAISNLGMFGIDNFDAVINPPHGAILAVGAGVKKPVVDKDGSLGVATIMATTLSVDHRVIDGALGAEVLQVIVDTLEAPLGLLA